MPAIIAHHLFGIEAYSELQPVIGTGDGARDAFLLGNLGPDPLFCLKALPAAVPFREIGSIMHAEQTAELLCALHRRCANSEDEAVRAHALGFLCHYLLDSAVHPLVYAQQNALCAARDGAAKTTDGGTVHAAIETEFDERVLHAKLGVSVDEFSPHRETLTCPSGALAAISAELPGVIDDVYGIAMPARAYASSVRLYRAAQRAIDSKRKGIRRRVDYARLTGKRYPHVLALTHSARERDGAAFANDDHVPWPHPFQPEAVVRESFDELYDGALERAIELVPQFATAGLSADACEELTGGLNFRGERTVKHE